MNRRMFLILVLVAVLGLSNIAAVQVPYQSASTKPLVASTVKPAIHQYEGRAGWTGFWCMVPYPAYAGCRGYYECKGMYMRTWCYEPKDSRHPMEKQPRRQPREEKFP